MVRHISAIPLAAVDAIVLDTETTGLDVKTARIIQVGAVGIRQGELVAGEELDRYVDPGVPVPAASTAVHGITDADVKGAPAFAAINAELDGFVRERILVGHSIGFDLAMMKAECERAGIAWRAPRSLCTRMLAQVANPRLPTYEMEALASWLGVDISGRHSAIGDARVTARIFLALVPRLRERNVRTLAEAEAACRQLANALEEQYKAGWLLPVRTEEAALSEKAMARVDAYPYRHRVRDVMSAPPIVLKPQMPLREALATFVERRVSSVFVGDAEALVRNQTGILTERDVLRAVAADGAEALTHPVADYANMPLETVFADAYLYRAIGRMSRLKVRHLGVADEDGVVIGAISARDLLRMRTTDAISLGDEIDTAPDERALGAAFARLPTVASGLRTEEVDGREIAGVISRELCAMTRRAAVLGEAAMERDGLGRAPADYALLVLGSGGRGESLLAADQDNAIVYADIADSERDHVEAWFAELGKRIADTLNEAGIPYCQGGIMAKNPEWRMSVSAWKARVDGWIRKSKPQDLLNVDIFYDMRAVHGHKALADEIWGYAHEQGSKAVAFLKLLAEQAAGFHPPIGFLGGFKTENGRIDLKKGGLFPLVANARVLSIRHSIMHRSTPDRLNGVRALDIGAGNDLERAVDAHAVLLEMMLDQQIDDIEHGLPATNSVAVASLSGPRQERLKRALNNLSNLDDMVRDLLFAKS